IRLYESLGYQACSEATLEAGFEKVAIFGDPMGYSHAARQLPDGWWTSKIGGMEDIEHATPDALVGDEYGVVVQVMRRPSPVPPRRAPCPRRNWNRSGRTSPAPTPPRLTTPSACWSARRARRCRSSRASCGRSRPPTPPTSPA